MIRIDDHAWRYSSDDATTHAYPRWMLADLGIRTAVAACGVKTVFSSLFLDIDAKGRCCDTCELTVSGF